MFTHVNFRKDVRLPVQLQRAMAAEAEAAREARAKVCIYEIIIPTSAFTSITLSSYVCYQVTTANHFFR